MCCVRVGNQKLQARWRAEQNKRQRVFVFHKKLGFVLWGIYWLTLSIKSENLIIDSEFLILAVTDGKKFVSIIEYG